MHCGVAQSPGLGKELLIGIRLLSSESDKAISKTKQEKESVRKHHSFPAPINATYIAPKHGSIPFSSLINWSCKIFWDLFWFSFASSGYLTCAVCWCTYKRTGGVGNTIPKKKKISIKQKQTHRHCGCQGQVWWGREGLEFEISRCKLKKGQREKWGLFWIF